MTKENWWVAAKIFLGLPVLQEALEKMNRQADQSHFIRDFKMIVGSTPLQYATKASSAQAVRRVQLQPDGGGWRGPTA